MPNRIFYSKLKLRYLTILWKSGWVGGGGGVFELGNPEGMGGGGGSSSFEIQVGGFFLEQPIQRFSLSFTLQKKYVSYG